MGNRRTVQFLVERPCEESGNGIETSKCGVFPTAIWVFWPPEENLYHGCSSPRVYRHDPRTEVPGPEHKRNPGHCVCDHMGHLIE